MAKSKNKEVLLRAGARFLRVAAASVLALVVPSILDLLPQLELGPDLSGVVSLLLIPALVALDKFLRDKKIY